MGKLILDSLEIKNFRTFQHLTIERLGRVNLIVGKNNVGKTSLLEALRLFANRGFPPLIGQILLSREEIRSSLEEIESDFQNQALLLRSLFYGRKKISVGDRYESIQIGAYSPDENTLTIEAGWDIQKSNTEYLQDVFIPRVSVQRGNAPKASYALTTILSQKAFAAPGFEEIINNFIPSSGLETKESSDFWDRVILTVLEEDVLKILRVVTPEVERVNFIGDWGVGIGRVPVVKLKGLGEAVPLRSLGDGMNRLFGLVLALVNSKNGLLLVDEIENGIHYSVQPDMWRLLFETARRLNVQVFATTHSWDCVEAFQKAAEEDKQEEGLLIRLQQKKGQIVSAIFDEHDLAIATDADIEVR
jgi:hypothetical protein